MTGTKKTAQEVVNLLIDAVLVAVGVDKEEDREGIRKAMKTLEFPETSEGIVDQARKISNRYWEVHYGGEGEEG